MTIDEICRFANELKTKHNWPEKTLEERVAYITSEVGEATNEVIKLRYTKDKKEVEKIKEALGMELYDIVWNVCDLANMVDIDLTKSFEKKARILATRDWQT